MIACLDCISLYESKWINYIPEQSFDNETLEDDEPQTYIPCPTKGCHGQLVDIDELILPVIIVLNFKGYITKFSCAGHIHDECCQTYIMFEKGTKLDSIPEGFSVIDDDEIDGLMIERLHEDRECFLSIQAANSDLYTWARSLPNLNKEYEASISDRDSQIRRLQVAKLLALGIVPYCE